MFFGIGSSGLSGSIGNLITDDTGSGNGAEEAVDRASAQVRAADAKTKATPTNAAAWAELAMARYRLAQLGDNIDPAASYTAEGRRQLTAAGAAFDKYVALDPPQPDERLVRNMTQAYLAIEQPAKAVTAQEMLTEIEPTDNTFSNLAILAYQAGQTRKGDLASAKAVELTEGADEKKELKEQLDQAKSQSALQQIQEVAPTPTPTVG
ncbi:hypothetical protein [Solirubrobacter deserti]|uniref:Tetratricopeptide repeat protein n=1 Tax=Solirubrobacter deserti TaxID=2282478 RepID=A0ABT4RC37_9ACTN|nr:hypothetical protein [Solirubrobacter deserti]MDA0136089.1 hypothetical protein [Solirubrobacter deserti]